MNLLKTISRNIPQLNWMRIGLLLVLLASWTVFVDQRATHRCELRQEKQKTEQAEVKLEKVAEHVEERLPVVAKKEKASAELRGDVVRTKNKNEGYIYENETRNSGSCDLSDVEFSGMQELIRQSREATK